MSRHFILNYALINYNDNLSNIFQNILIYGGVLLCAKLQITLLKSMAGCSFEAIVEQDLEEDTDEIEVSLLYSICIFSTSCCL